MAKEIPDYLQRMKDEGKQLRAKTYALAGYLQGTAGQMLPTEKRMLMEKRLKAMRKYSHILAECIALEK